ncbi:WbqC family protein [Croceicoccus naphthovorans]|nr:WbqC family protein [Croceicoccus naphthovorans]
MQPYLFPYLGYFQVINASDIFFSYDNAQYMKGGYVNRNKIHPSGGTSWFALPVSSSPVNTPINQKSYADRSKRDSLLQRLQNCYRKAPHQSDIVNLVDLCLTHPSDNVAELNTYSIKQICAFLGISTPVRNVSEINFHGNSGQDKVLSICKAQNAGAYINPIGGAGLYDRSAFATHGIELQFLKSHLPRYQQFGSDWFPSLSIIDVMMFNSASEIRELLECYDLA